MQYFNVIEIIKFLPEASVYIQAQLIVMIGEWLIKTDPGILI